MTVRLANTTARGLALGFVTAILAVGIMLHAATPGVAGSSTHVKTTPGKKQTAEPTPEAEAAPEETSGEAAAKTAKAEDTPDTTAADEEARSAAGAIGAGWETDTTIRPEGEEREITDQEALEIVEKVNAYFNNLQKFKAEFVQTDANNKQQSGDFYFKRPGKVRFDYDRPSMMKIISNGEYLAVENHDLRTADRYSLDATPFGLLLADEVNLLRDARILAIDRGEDVLILTVEDKTGKSAGQIRLFFRTDPELELASWIISDPQGLDTRIDLAELEHDVELSASLFEFSGIGMKAFER